MAVTRLNLEQAAAFLGLEAQALLRRVREGEAPYSGDPGAPVFDKDELDAWASSRILGMDGRRLDRYERGAAACGRPGDGLFPLGSLVSPERVFLDVDARTRASMLSALVDLADSLGLLYDPRDLLESLRAREDLCSTALSGGFAVPHPRHHDPYLAQESFLLVARPSAPVHFGAQDGRPTDHFFLLVCQDDRQHLRALARLCAVLSDPARAAALRAAETSEDLCAALAGR